MKTKTERNKEYWQRTKNRIILREEELTPHAVKVLYHELKEQELSNQDRRCEKLKSLYERMTGEEI
jgi:hypothetical protein